MCVCACVWRALILGYRRILLLATATNLHFRTNSQNLGYHSYLSLISPMAFKLPISKYLLSLFAFLLQSSTYLKFSPLSVFILSASLIVSSWSLWNLMVTYILSFQINVAGHPSFLRCRLIYTITCLGDTEHAQIWTHLWLIILSHPITQIKCLPSSLLH